jgi:hypothetical protein
MEIKPIRDSCVLYLDYAEQDAQELVERLYMQRRHSFIRKCPVCGKLLFIDEDKAKKFLGD